jgi:DNA-binding IclR family transcriptional regulator
MDEIEAEAKNPVQSITKVFDIVEYVAERDGASISELASALEMPKSSVHSYVSTLHAEEYLVKHGREYRIGLRFLTLGSKARLRKAVFDVAKPKAEQLAKDTGERVFVVVEERGLGVYIYQTSGANAVGLDARVGTRLPLHCTAVGKALLATLPSDRVDQIVETRGLSKVNQNTITDRTTLEDELETIRNRGYAIDYGERHETVRCVAAPVLDRNQANPHAAISVAGPANRLRGDWFEEDLPEIIRSTASEIELNLSYG